MKHFVLGRGQVGQAVMQILDQGGQEVSSYDLKDGEKDLPLDFEVIHVCIPYTTKFIQQIKPWTKLGKHMIIYSTVPIGTCKKLGAVHSPIEGKHPDLALSIKYMQRWIGTDDKAEYQFFHLVFADLGLRTRWVGSSDHTEALKLLSTAEYGLNIAFTQYKAEVAEAIGMEFELVKTWNRDYNQLYRDLELDDRFQKFVLDPPHGKIGGHCVVPNAEILQKQYPHKLVKVIKEFK